MSQERLTVRKIKEILRLKFEAGLSNRAIGRACRVSCSTISEYIQRARHAGLSWPLPVIVPEEVVAALHEEQDLGFGEITKLLQITVEAQAACALEGINCDVTLDSLIAEYKAGAGMGELFKIYGKPEYTGIGQVRKAAEPVVKSNNGKAKGKK